MAQPVVQSGAEVLRQRASELGPEVIASAEFKQVLAEMVDTMRKAPGVGLAAPQIGIPWRVFVVEDREELMASLTAEERERAERVPVPLRCFVNPVVRPIGEERVTFFEGCLSVIGYAALVPRHREVEVSALDETGKPVTWRVRGWPARILQHEMDHLEGNLYVDRMYTRTFGAAMLLKERFSGVPIADVLESFGVREGG